MLYTKCTYEDIVGFMHHNELETFDTRVCSTPTWLLMDNSMSNDQSMTLDNKAYVLLPLSYIINIRCTDLIQMSFSP